MVCDKKERKKEKTRMLWRVTNVKQSQHFELRASSLKQTDTKRTFF